MNLVFAHVFGEDRDAMADVRFDVVQVRRRAAVLATVEGHDLHQSARTDAAPRFDVELRVPGVQPEDARHPVALFVLRPRLHDRDWQVEQLAGLGAALRLSPVR